MALRPCEVYSRDRASSLFGSGLDYAQILALNIPVADRVWVGVRLCADPLKFAKNCAERAKKYSRADSAAAHDAERKLQIADLLEIGDGK